MVPLIPSLRWELYPLSAPHRISPSLAFETHGLLRRLLNVLSTFASTQVGRRAGDGRELERSNYSALCRNSLSLFTSPRELAALRWVGD